MLVVFVDVLQEVTSNDEVAQAEGSAEIAEDGQIDRLRTAQACGRHTLRRSFGTHVLQDGYDTGTVRQLVGHSDVRAKMIYTHVLNRVACGVKTPENTL